MRYLLPLLLILLGLFGRQSLAEQQLQMVGINLAGAEFGKTHPGDKRKDYAYPPAKDFDYWKSRGFTLIRIPFRWERIQNSPFGDINDVELQDLRATIELARERGMKVVLDVHSYGRFSHKGRLGGPHLSYKALADLWGKLAGIFANDPVIWGYGLMNEPHGLPDGVWQKAAQETVDAIRAVDTSTTVLIAGENWSSAHTWRKYNENLRITDPVNNLRYEAHVYFDKDHTGTYKYSFEREQAYTNRGVDRLKPFVAWLTEKNAKGFIGEYGNPPDDEWLKVQDRTMAYMLENDLPSTYWSAGSRWNPRYPLLVGPDANGNDRPQVRVLEKYLNKSRQNYKNAGIAD